MRVVASHAEGWSAMAGWVMYDVVMGRLEPLKRQLVSGSSTGHIS